MSAVDYFHQLNRDYLALHRAKEDLFWSTYMGTSDNHEGFTAAESKVSAFISDPQQAVRVREQLAALAQEAADNADSEQTQQVEHGLRGWLAMFEANSIDSEQGRQMMAALIKQESELFAKRQQLAMHYTDENGKQQEASLTVLAANIRASDNETVRRSSHQALLDLESWVANNGFIELIKARNAFAREMGFRNFFDYQVNKTEQMTPEQLFAILDDFEQRTRERNLDSLSALKNEHGEQALTGYNFAFTWGGDSARQLDPYVPFAKSLRRWVESFGRLNIDFSGAEMALDLLDRKGKYQNGFCHGPVPAYFDQSNGGSTWVPAKVNFTSNAKPDQVGSGYDGINTLFHEGGHAAHFANMKQNAPCFSQEFAPTSMAYAETQSMFCDSLLEDADWLKLYAKDDNGQPAPDTLIKTMIDTKLPFKAFEERMILVVPYFEWALYSLDDSELTPENLLSLARETEQRILGLGCSPRPLLAIPHLLSQEAACSYQGYLLAHMAVYQTRAYFEQKYGYLTDNPSIGPELAKHYWQPGNSVNHNATLLSLTGEGFNAKYLADFCNQSTEQAWQQAQRKMQAAAEREQPPVASLNAKIQVVDGSEVLASNAESDEAMCAEFEAVIAKRYG